MEDSYQWMSALLLVLVLLGVVLYLYARSNRRQRLRDRIKTEIARQGSAVVEQKTVQHIQSQGMKFLLRLGRALPLLNSAQRLESSNKLVSAGYRSDQAMLVLLGLTVASVVAGLGLMAWFGGAYLDQYGKTVWTMGMIVAAYLGSLFPRLVLDYQVKRRQEAIRQALPDALDLMVICTNAGLGLNATLSRTAIEMQTVAPALADEFKLTASQLKLSSDTEFVLNGLASRTNLEGIRIFVSTLIQARKYGTAITQALRILAKTERTARMMRLEEAAAKLAVKMTIPMMLFILPTVIIVGAGPAVINLMRFFSGQ
ncbi:type II secretion system F family protein [Castellaniella sp.]|uniref:type II secretion system F family protein n=1 Tax=Castellaniella sp. TaxID=1955812 RepID=UPI002AFECEA7|nr:type II secretion system F family protein [Castellaniella sp.]